MRNLKHGTPESFSSDILHHLLFFFYSYSPSSSPFTVHVYKVHDLISELYLLFFLVGSGLLLNVILSV